jgi:hypothetical protein
MEFLETALTTHDMKAYRELEYPFNVGIIADRLAAKLAKDDTFEMFLPLVYWRHEAALTVPGAAVKVAPYLYFISNKGRVVNMRNTTDPKFVEWSLDSSGYPHIVVNIQRKPEPLTIHRAIACGFVPIPESLKGSHPKDLIVTHKDNNKAHFETDNLVWSLPPEKLNGAA